MPKCVVCNEMLPPEFMKEIPNAKPQRCLFCERGINSISYFSKSEGTKKTTTKAETIREYKEFLQEVSEISNVKDIIEAVRNRSTEEHIVHTKNAIDALNKE